VHIDINTQIHACAHVHTPGHTCIYMHTCADAGACGCVNVCVCMHVCVCVCVCVCVVLDECIKKSWPHMSDVYHIYNCVIEPTISHITYNISYHLEHLISPSYRTCGITTSLMAHLSVSCLTYMICDISDISVWTCSVCDTTYDM